MFKKLFEAGFITLLVCSMGYAASIEHTFTRADVPQIGQVRISGIDFTTTQNIDIGLPNNLTYVLRDVLVQSKAVTTLSAGATVAITEVTSAGSAVQTLSPSRALSSTDSTGSIQDVSPVAASAGGTGFIHFTAPATATTALAFVTVTNLTSATQDVTIAAGSISDPVVARNAVITLTDAAGDNLAGLVTVNGTDISGRTVAEASTVVTGTVSYVGSVAFKTITSVVYNFSTNGAASDTIAMGYGVKLGVPYNPDMQSGLAVTMLLVDGATDAVSASDATYGTFTSTTAPNATRDFDVSYTYDGAAAADAITGSNLIRLGITGGTATNDTKDVVMSLTAF